MSIPLRPGGARILALDCATEACSVALVHGDARVGRRAELARGHAEALLDMVQEVLAEAGVGLPQLDAVAASVGPGSFTGVRVGVSVAQGLAFGAELPVLPVSTLEALAATVIGAPAERALAALDARMGEVYVAVLCADVARGVSFEAPPQVIAPERVGLAGAARAVGRAFSVYPALAALPGLTIDPAAATALPDAGAIATLAQLRFAQGEGRDPAELAPLYVRNHVALTEAERARR